jgi:hypothetical protein
MFDGPRGSAAASALGNLIWRRQHSGRLARCSSGGRGRRAVRLQDSRAAAHSRPVRRVAAVALVLAAILCPFQGITAAQPSRTPAWATRAAKLLTDLPVKPPASMAGYSRARFGPPWKDTDRNGLRHARRHPPARPPKHPVQGLLRLCDRHRHPQRPLHGQEDHVRPRCRNILRCADRSCRGARRCVENRRTEVERSSPAPLRERPVRASRRRRTRERIKGRREPLREWLRASSGSGAGGCWLCGRKKSGVPTVLAA